MAYRFPLDQTYAEYIFAPFHDPEHSPGIPDKLQAYTAVGLVREHAWCWTAIGWKSAKAGAKAFTYRFSAPFTTQSHDTLIVAISMPLGATAEIALLGPAFQRVSKWVGCGTGKGHRQELKVPVAKLLLALLRMVGAHQFSGLALRVHAAADGPGVVSLSWAAMRHSTLFDAVRKQRAAFQPDWSPWILPLSQWGPVQFERGLLFDPEALTDVRAKKTRDGWREHFALLECRAQEYMRRNPEADFGDYLPNHDLRYIREHEQGRTAYHWEALVLGFVGLVNEDRTMMLHALRYLMCMVHSRYWADSAEHRIPSSTWNQRAFIEEMTATSVALLADWFAFALTPKAKNLIRHAIWDKGLTPVRRDLMQFEVMHRMNQGAVFCRANIIGGLYLEGAWPRVTSVIDEAYGWMNAVLDHYVKSDGGVHEGIGYLCQLLTAVLWAVIAYCRARNLDWRQVVRERFGHIERYVRAMSASHPGLAIPASDCRTEWFGGDAIPILADVFRGSAYGDILRNCLCEGTVHELTGTLAKSGGLVGMVYGPQEIPVSRSVVLGAEVLLESGKVSLCAEKDTVAARVWISASSRSATHAHRDHGQFILEVNGQPIFVDRGMVQYWFEEAHILSRSWMHNVLTPVFSQGVFAEQDFADGDDRIVANLAESGGQVKVAGNGVWRECMDMYSRHFDIDLPTLISVVDSGELRHASRLAFHLHSPHHFEVSGTSAYLRLAKCQIEVALPWADHISCEKCMHDLLRRPLFHLCATSPDMRSFSLETEIRITPIST